MNKFALSYKHINEIIQKQNEYNLSTYDIEALKIAQNALLLVEMLGISVNENSQKVI